MHFEATALSVLIYAGAFGVPIGSLFVYGGGAGSLYDSFGIIVEPLWVYQSRLKKTFIFPIDFNDLIKAWACFRVALGSLWDHFWHMKVTFGAFRGHFEVTLGISTSNFMCDVCVMHTCTGLVGSKMGKV